MNRSLSSCSALCILLILALGTFLSACSSSRPVAANPKMYRQERISAVDHWDTIADQVASRLFLDYERRDDLITKPVYIIPPASEELFPVTFYNLLKTRLVNKGMQVSETKTADSLLLEYEVQAVLHDPKLADYIPSFSDIGLAVVSVFSGAFTSRSDTEIVITAKAACSNRYVMHLSMVYYVDNDELTQYVSLRPYDPMSQTTRTVRVQGY